MEELTNEPQSVQPEAASTEPATDVETGETQQGTNVENTAVQADQTTQPTKSDVPEDFEWDGDVNKLPAPLQSQAKGMLRHMHKVTQEAAQVKRDAEGFQQIVNHPEFQQFLEWQQQQSNPAAAAQQQPTTGADLTEEELLLAQSDPRKFQGLLQNHISKSIQPVIQQGMQKIQHLERELALSKQEKNIDSFAAQNPDFYKINPVIMKAAIRETGGRSLQDAYTLAKKLEAHYLDKANTSISQKVAEKKKAVSASPSRSVTPQVVYVDSEADAMRVAYENATLGKRVDVRVKKKK